MEAVRAQAQRCDRRGTCETRGPTAGATLLGDRALHGHRSRDEGGPEPNEPVTRLDVRHYQVPGEHGRHCTLRSKGLSRRRSELCLSHPTHERIPYAQLRHLDAPSREQFLGKSLGRELVQRALRPFDRELDQPHSAIGLEVQPRRDHDTLAAQPAMTDDTASTAMVPPVAR